MTTTTTPSENRQWEQDRLVGRFADAVATYRQASGHTLVQVPDDLLIALARAATDFFQPEEA